MSFVKSTLPPTASIRLIDPVKGRGLFAEKDFAQGEVVLVDKPLIAMQHVKNRMFAPTCANCFRFLGSLEYQLTYLANLCGMTKSIPKKFKFPKSGNLAPDQDPFFTTAIVECPGKCGEKYCSEECQQRAYNEHHQLLCVGPIDDVTHPLVLFKQYAIENNEIFLLAAQLIVRVIMHYKHTGSREGTDILSLLHHKAWWDVVVDNKEEHAQELEQDLKRILTESLDLLTQAILNPILTQFPNAQIKDLFTMEFYSHLIGMLEMYDNTVEIKSPLQTFLRNQDLLPKEAYTNVLFPLRDRLAILKQEQEDAEDHDHDDEDEEMEGEEGGEEEEAGDEGMGAEEEELEFPGFDGLGVFPTSAMSNHSCEPNCIVKYDKDHSLLFVTKRNITKGEELTHSYIDDDLPLEERRENLREYGFWCDCPRCLREEAEQKNKS